MNHPSNSRENTSADTDLKWMIWHVLRVYFAPITGAIKGVRAEYRRLDEEATVRRLERGKAETR